MPIPIAIGAAAIGGAASLAGGIIQNRANRRAQDRAFEQNKQFCKNDSTKRHSTIHQ